MFTWVNRMMNWLLVGLSAASVAQAAQETAAAAAPSIDDVLVQPMKEDQHTSPTLRPYAGRVLLIVNVASKCGFTPQYAGLEKLYRHYKDQGLVVLGFPCNQFLFQEPGSEEQIISFCRTKYDVTFPIYAKIAVNGKNQAPLYKLLTGPASPEPGVVKWNFEKFLIGRDGRILARFRSRVKPDDPRLIAAVEKALAEKATAKEPAPAGTVTKPIPSR